MIRSVKLASRPKQNARCLDEGGIQTTGTHIMPYFCFFTNTFCMDNENSKTILITGLSCIHCIRLIHSFFWLPQIDQIK